MTEDREKYQLQEYVELRKEITFLEDSIGKLFMASIVASISILSALGALLFKANPSSTCMPNSVSAYFLLSPPLILIPTLYLLVSHRRGIHRAGTYLQVFIEEHGYGPG